MPAMKPTIAACNGPAVGVGITMQLAMDVRLASEAALSTVLEKALLLQRTLLTGKKEPNVVANELAVKAVDQENNALEQEINNLKTELELRRTLAGNSAMAIVQRDF